MRDLINRALNIPIVYKLTLWLIVGLMLLGMASPIIVITYIQRYVYDSNTTATKGLYFKKTIDLTKYQKLGHGNNLFGTYDRYSRSAMQGEGQVLTVYKD